MVARGWGKAWVAPTMPAGGFGTVGTVSGLGLTGVGHLKGDHSEQWQIEMICDK